MKQRTPHRFQPRVEALEDRWMPSTVYGAQVLNTLGNAVQVLDPNGHAVASQHINDFEPDGLNNSGQVFYVSDLIPPAGYTPPPGSTPEGVFLQSGSTIKTVTNGGAPAPGGGQIGSGVLGPVTLNNDGDGALAILLTPGFLPNLPFGSNAGVYRFSDGHPNTLTGVEIPNVTKVPGGEGTKFVGADFGPTINNNGDLVFGGMVPTDEGIHVVGQTYSGVGLGIFKSNAAGKLSSVVVPGDHAPGGGEFDSLRTPTINDNGVVAFAGHIEGEPAQIPGITATQDQTIYTFQNVYFKDGSGVHLIAHVGDHAPGGGTFKQLLYPDINNQGDVLFAAALTLDASANQTLGVFLYSATTKRITAVVRPGEAMPGGGHCVSTSFVGPGEIHLNNQGVAVFNCSLDTDGNPDTGLYQWSQGQLSLIARTGTNIAGVGTVQALQTAGTVTGPVGQPLTSGAINNDKGQVLFSVVLTDGRTVLLLETPKNHSDGHDDSHASVQDTNLVVGNTTPQQTTAVVSSAAKSDQPATSLAIAAPSPVLVSASSLNVAAARKLSPTEALDDVFAGLWDD